MDNQLSIPQPYDFKTQFRQTHKNILNFYYIFSCFLGVSGILFVLSSFMLNQDEYHKNMQICIIVLSCVMIAFVVANIFLVCNMNGSSFSFTFISLIVFLIIGLICIIAFLSQIFRIFNTFCNYNITHAGFYDGSNIISHFQSYYNSICSQISHSDQTSEVYNLAQKYLYDNCQGDDSCIDQSSLHVYYMYNDASFQLAALIIGGFLDLLFIAVIIKIRRIVKYTNQMKTKDALAKEALVVEIPNKKQNLNIQPAQINPQIISPIPSYCNQALQNQSIFNNQQSNPNSGQQCLNPGGILYLQQQQQLQY
ncbi:hypothetical protein ABPG73_011497 [Tetrahymena malaccensis]